MRSSYKDLIECEDFHVKRLEKTENNISTLKQELKWLKRDKQHTKKAIKSLRTSISKYLKD